MNVGLTSATELAEDRLPTPIGHSDNHFMKPSRPNPRIRRSRSQIDIVAGSTFDPRLWDISRRLQPRR